MKYLKINLYGGIPTDEPEIVNLSEDEASPALYGTINDAGEHVFPSYILIPIEE